MILYNLTLGIPVRNESLNLKRFIDSLNNSVNYLQNNYKNIKVEIIFCVNGSTDNSANIIETLASSTNFDINLIFSKAGKLNAIDAILEFRKYDDLIGFIDADILLKLTAIYELYVEIVNDKNLFVVYSNMIPRGRDNFIYKIQKSHYDSRILNRRGYIHGRFYILKNADLMKTKRITRDDKVWLLKYGPLVDDMFFSRIIVAIYGIQAIKEVEKSIIYFTPPQNFKDFFFGYRRIILELKRLSFLYPEHNFIQKKYFSKNRYRFKKFNSYQQKFLYFFYQTTVYFIKIIVGLEILLINLKILKLKHVWKTTHSTKVIQIE